MKRMFVFSIVFIVLCALFVNKFLLSHQTNHMYSYVVKPSSISINPSSQKTTTLFVPYWTLHGKTFPQAYDTVAYFGIAANNSGIDTQEDGYKDISKFTKLVEPQQKMLLTVRLLDQNLDEKLLHDAAFQEKIIHQSIRTAKQYGFDGILLDLEYKALAFDEVVHSITNFTKAYAKETKKNNIKLYTILYGDTLYRARPFDMAAIGKASDGIFVLAYDFHKANGNPGPNFPLNELPDEEYSFMQMVQDFSQKIPTNKLTIVFGLFGYNWEITDKNQSVGEATPITTVQAGQEFSHQCLLTACKVIRNTPSSEMIATYADKNKNPHEVWWEDMNSVQKKEEYLTSKGIYSSSLWAWGYF